MCKLSLPLAVIILLLLGWQGYQLAQSQPTSQTKAASQAVEFKMDDDGPNVIPIAFSPDGQLLTGGDDWNQVRVWNAQTR